MRSSRAHERSTRSRSSFSGMARTPAQPLIPTCKYRPWASDRRRRWARCGDEVCPGQRLHGICWMTTGQQAGLNIMWGGTDISQAVVDAYNASSGSAATSAVCSFSKPHDALYASTACEISVPPPHDVQSRCWTIPASRRTGTFMWGGTDIFRRWSWRRV